MVALVVPFSEFAFGLQQVVQVATVKSATLDMDLVGTLTDLFWSGCVLNWLFPGARTINVCRSF